MKVEKIVTKHLCLRQCTIEDITPGYINALNDPEVIGLTEARHRKWDENSVRHYVEESNMQGVSQLIGIFLKESSRHIGNIRLFNFSEVHKHAELGIMIWDKTQWSKGYGAESLNAVCDYAFNILNLHKIYADYYSVNAASARLFDKAGFKIEGVFKDHFLLNGKYIDSVRIAKFSYQEGNI